MKKLIIATAALALLSGAAFAAKPNPCRYLIVKGTNQGPVLTCGPIISESNSKVNRNPHRKCHPKAS